jgi:squalene-associated FAD-dependent desaturase
MAKALAGREMDSVADRIRLLIHRMSSTPIPSDLPKQTVAVIGGGVAGLAAAVAAVQCGFYVELFEQAPAPGGRAGSYHDSKAGHLVDLSPHVAMGCCTNLLDLCGRTEIADAFDRYATLHFIGPDGTRYDFVPSRWLPAPLHLMTALGRLRYLSGRQRRAIGRAMLRLARTQTSGDAAGPTMGDWLRRQRQPQECIRYFWALVLESALGDSLDHVSVAAARKVFVDGFMATREAYEVLVSRVPLGELWQRVCTWLARHGAKIHMRSRIERLDVTCGPSIGAADETPVPQIGLILPEGLCRMFDHVVAAVSWKQLGNLLGPELLRRIPRAEAGAALQSSPITALHLWFDRAVTDLPHAALVGRLSQWVFNHNLPSPFGRGAGGEGERFHYTVVISASHALAGRDTKDVLNEVLGELQSIWPAAAAAQLLHHRVLTQPGAVFSVRPGTDAMRPDQQTTIAGLYLAGDWTATEWPATMEGAVRSGYLAVESLLAALGRPQPVLVPDLKKSWLTRRIEGIP